MTILTEERIVFLIVLLSIPALVYAVEKLTKRRIYNRKIIILIYVMLTWFYLDKVEIYYRNKIIRGKESLQQETTYPSSDPIFDTFYNAIKKLIPLQDESKNK